MVCISIFISIFALINGNIKFKSQYMKIVVSSSVLLTHLHTISRVVNAKNPLPIMDCFLFSVEGTILTIKATDQDTTLTTTVELIESEKDGLFALEAKKMLDALRELPDQPITISVSEDDFLSYVYYQNGKYSLVGRNGMDFPVKPALSDEAIKLNMSVETLFDGISKTGFAASDDELRPVMNGILFDAFEDNLTFVATDTHKLVRYKNYKVANTGVSNFILPKKPAIMLKNILPKESGDVSISFDSKNAYFEFSNYKMECRLIEGRYPNYNAVIPAESRYKLVIDRLTFISALRRVSVFANQSSNLIRIALNDNQLNISAQDTDFSTSAEETLSCQYEGNEIKIGFKATLLIEILNNISSTEIEMGLSDSSRPGIILPVDDSTDESLLMLIMPMMLNN